LQAISVVVALSRTLLVAVLSVLPVASGAVVRETSPEPRPGEKVIDPDADRILKAMSNYLKSLPSFRVMTSSTDEIVTKSGQKIQFATDDEVTVERPNKLRSEQVGASRSGLSFWDDGKSMTLYCRAEGTYATADVPGDIDATLDEVRKRYQIEAPGADLLCSHPYQALTEQVTRGQLVDRESVDGVAANHLAFIGQDVDWQIWIEDGPEPLPLRFVITTKTLPSHPQYTVRLSQWEPHAAIPDSTFSFQAPAGAERVSEFPAACGTRAKTDTGVPYRE
jgi:hypothetical protein